jgi:hypothetical protein
VVRRASLIMLLCGCAQPPTSLFVSLFSSASLPNPPTALGVSVWDKHGPIVLGRVAHGRVPGTLYITNLPDVTQEVRVGLADADTNVAVFGFRAPLIAHQQTHLDVHLDGTTDADGDLVPDNIDDCPRDANSEQRDGDGDNVGDACEGRDLGGADLPALADFSSAIDLAGADLTPKPCTVLFCDDFDTDVINAGHVTTAAGSPLWTVDDLPPQENVEIDFTGGALGSAHAIRMRLVPDLTDGGTVNTYQRLSGDLTLYSVPNLTKILTGPTYMRFFVKLSRPPADLYSPSVTLGYVYWGGDPTNNLELLARPDGVEFNDRYSFAAINSNTNVLAVNWVSDWVCVEWKHQASAGDGGATDYHATVSVNGMPAGTFDGSGVPPVFGGFILGADVEFRSEVPNLTDFTEYFDEVKFSDAPIGCSD